jgi:hypothetical protein
MTALTNRDHTISNPRLAAYLRRHGAVPGWLDPYSARFIATIGGIQRRAAIHGGVAEIGVHEGRLFILLKLLANEDETAVAIDIFADQHLNADASGRGDEQRFLSNVTRHAGPDGVVLLRGSSLQLRAPEITRHAGPCRLFSIDGGHTAECALNDLMLADACLHPNGVAILDDYFNPRWPDVSTGTAAYLANGGRLRPFAISPNKLFLADPGSHALYQRELKRLEQDFLEAEASMFGSPVIVFGVEPETWTAGKRFRRWAKGTALGARLASARRRHKLQGNARPA